MRSGFSQDNRSVTEVLGYVIIFALIISVIGFVTTLGMPALTDVQDSEQTNNAERAFDVIGDNMAAVYERGVPSRSTEIDLGGSELFYGDPVTLNVTVDGEPNEFDIRPVMLQVNDGTTLVYEGGAVFKDKTEGGLILRSPPLLLSNDRVHVPIINTTAPAIEAAGGTTVLLRGESTNRSVLHAGSDGATTVTLTVESPRYDLWKRYFLGKTDIDESDCTVDDTAQTVQCELSNPDRVYVTLQEIELSIIL